MNSLLATRDTPAARLTPWLRWGAAAVFALFGVAKFTAHATEVSSFRGYGLPAPDAFVYAIGTLEIVGAALLAAGLLTRLAALALAGDMIGAIVASGLAKGELVSLTLGPALLAAMLVLLWVGPGRAALDTRLRASRDQADPPP
jgi:putative oxidoreductase